MQEKTDKMNDLMQSVYDILPTGNLDKTHILNLLPVAVYTCDMHGMIQRYNEKAADLWGRRPVVGDKNECFSGAGKLYYTDGTYMPHDQTPVAGCLKDGLQRKDTEVIIERSDLSRIWVRENIVPIINANGNQVGIINCFSDITAEKKTDNELQKKKEELQDYVDNASIGLHWVDVNGIIKWANRSELDMLGYTEEEYIGHHIAEFHVSSQKIGDILTRLGNNEILNQYESELRCKDGTIKTVLINSSVLWENGKFIHTRCFTIDVTEQKKLFRKLAESEAKYRKLAATLKKKVLENIHDLRNKTKQLKNSEERYHKMVDEVEDYAIILLDKDGIIQNWNKGAEKIKGYKEEEIVGKSFQTFYLPADREEGFPMKLLKKATEEGKAIHEGWRRRKDGSVFWGSIVLTALHDSQNKVIGFSKVTRDLTEKKQAEDKMKDYLSELEFQNKELEQFSYAASHDMKEPLRKIRLYNGYIADNAAHLLDEKSKEYLNRSIHAAERMKMLIEDLLSYSRATLNVEAHEEVDLNKIIEEILFLHKEEFDKKEVTIEIEKPAIIWAIPFQIKQVMFNLINNSIKYKHPERNVIIKIDIQVINGDEVKGLKTGSKEQYYKISIEDNGIGFNAIYAEKIFEIFQRLNNFTEVKGSGIGLAICKKIIQNHKGFIEAIGKPNEGASFLVYIPKAQSAVVQ